MDELREWPSTHQGLPWKLPSYLLDQILLTAGNEKPLGWLAFQQDSALLGTEQKSATNVPEGDTENQKLLNLAQSCCY